MRYKSYLLWMVGILFSISSMAQVTVKGKVTSADDGTTLPGVTIVVKNTSKGTVTDLDGNYEITVDKLGDTLVYSFIGMETLEKAVTGLTMDAQMSAGVELQEVVVTALGVSREKKSLGYSVQGVSGEDLSDAKEVNVVNSLSGKVSGIQVSSATGTMGGSSRILIRGAASIDNNNNQPLFVIDGVPVDNSNFSSADQERGGGGYDYGNAIQDIDPDNIADMQVLKGAAATALYGSRGANGVILITTKKGKASENGSVGISYRFGYSVDQVYVLPDYQNQYGGGFQFDTVWYDQNPEAFNDGGGYYNADGSVNNGSNPAGTYDLMTQYYVDESWGPEYDDDKMVRHWWSWDETGDYAGDFGQVAPWSAHPDNVKNFFNTGHTMTNSITLSNANDYSNWRLGYTNTDQKGVFPGSELKRNNFSFSGSNKFTKKLTGMIAVNYVTATAQGRPGTGYDANNVMQQFNQWGQRQWADDRMQEYESEGQQRTWNRRAWNDPRPQYTDNPYWTRHMNYQNDRRDRVYGYLGFSYQFADNLSLDFKAMTDFYEDKREERIAISSQEIPEYSLAERSNMENNYEVKLNYNTRFNEDFGVYAIIGGNVRDNFYTRNINETVGGLNAPLFYNLSNTVSPYVTDQYSSRKRVNSVFASASFDYLRMFFLDVTARNDWSTALPTESRSFFYPSISGSFVFSELESLQGNKVLSFGKIRAGWASVGNDTEPYRYAPAYTVDQGFDGRANVGNLTTMPNPNLLPEKTNSWEIGTEMRFLTDRIGLDFTYYNSDSYNQIISLPISAASGFQYQLINAGQMTNKGMELSIDADVIRTKDFNWNIRLNYAKNNSEVVELSDDASNYLLQNAPFAVSVNAVEGEPYGSIYGYAFERHENGGKLVDENGHYVRSENQEVIGNILPDWTGGVYNGFSYKNWSMGALIDMSIGGDVFSTTNMWARYSGMTEETAGNNSLGNPRRDPVLDASGNPVGSVLEGEAGAGSGGVLIEGVNSEGNDVRYLVDNQTSQFVNGGYNIGEADVYDNSFVYLREVTLNYRLPKSVCQKIKLTNLTVGLYGRNLWLMHSNIPHLDPTALTNSTSNIQGIEGAALPSVRTYGFNLSFNL